MVGYLNGAAAAQPDPWHGGRVLLPTFAKLSPRRPYGGALLVASEQKPKLGRFWLQTCITHTLRCRYAVPIWSSSLLQCSDKVHSRTSTYTLLPWLFARSLLRYRRSDSACFFTCKHACTVRPPSPPTPLKMRRWHLLCCSFDFLTAMGKVKGISLWSRQRKVHYEKWLCQS